MSVDDSASEASLDNLTASGYYGRQADRDSDICMSPASHNHHSSDGTFRDDTSGAGTIYRSSYVDPLRDSSEDERTEGQGATSGSLSNDTLSDTGAPRPTESDTSVSSGLSVDATNDPRLSFLGALCSSINVKLGLLNGSVWG
jgi:hypothetical protein